MFWMLIQISEDTPPPKKKKKKKEKPKKFTMSWKNDPGLVEIQRRSNVWDIFMMSIVRFSPLEYKSLIS